MGCAVSPTYVGVSGASHSDGMNETTQHAAGRERLAELRAQLERMKLLELLALRLAERADELEAVSFRDASRVRRVGPA